MRKRSHIDSIADGIEDCYAHTIKFLNTLESIVIKAVGDSPELMVVMNRVRNHENRVRCQLLYLVQEFPGRGDRKNKNFPGCDFKQNAKDHLYLMNLVFNALRSPRKDDFELYIVGEDD